MTTDQIVLDRDEPNSKVEKKWRLLNTEKSIHWEKLSPQEKVNLVDEMLAAHQCQRLHFYLKEDGKRRKKTVLFDGFTASAWKQIVNKLSDDKREIFLNSHFSLQMKLTMKIMSKP